ncbi:unnamed protein product [Orchesella dallaii]|uniref:F-box domain-containing protein n=1 Tax=Orchesella dallaii TaxID=48710 RepID=A0ABP1RGI6_9HEXA
MESKELGKGQTLRNWLLRIMRKPKKPQQMEPELQISTQSSDQVHISDSITYDFPPELIEAILVEVLRSNIPLLHLRLVCVRWKNVIDAMLEKEHLSLWTYPNLNDSIYNPTRSFFSISQKCPSIKVVIPRNSRTPPNRVWLPPALNTILEGNHFPKRSVAIVGFHGYREDNDEGCPSPIRKKIQKGSKKKNIVKLFTSSGQHLTSLVLHDLIIRRDHLIFILRSTSYLKCLTMSMIELTNGTETKFGSISPFLSNLHLHHCHSHREFLVKWILGRCSKQLTNLIVSSNKVLKRVSIDQKNFPKLEQLFLFGLPIMSLMGLLRNSQNPPPLKHVTLLWIPHECGLEDNEEIANFLSKISKSLVYLKIYVKFSSFLEVLKKCGKVFSNVRVIELVMYEYEDCEAFKYSISEWLPQLESVRVNYTSDDFERLYKLHCAWRCPNCYHDDP